jgi:hypothetical protein
MVWDILVMAGCVLQIVGGTILVRNGPSRVSGLSGLIRHTQRKELAQGAVRLRTRAAIGVGYRQDRGRRDVDGHLSGTTTVKGIWWLRRSSKGRVAEVGGCGRTSPCAPGLHDREPRA